MPIMMEQIGEIILLNGKNLNLIIKYLTLSSKLKVLLNIITPVISDC